MCRRAKNDGGASPKGRVVPSNNDPFSPGGISHVRVLRAFFFALTAASRRGGCVHATPAAGDAAVKGEGARQKPPLPSPTLRTPLAPPKSPPSSEGRPTILLVIKESGSDESLDVALTQLGRFGGWKHLPRPALPWEVARPVELRLSCFGNLISLPPALPSSLDRLSEAVFLLAPTVGSPTMVDIPPKCAPPRFWS